MASYIQIWNLWGDSNLRTRAAVACMKAAYDVINEDPNTGGHAERLKWAEVAFQNPQSAAIDIMWAVVSNPTIQEKGQGCADDEIQFVVNGYVDTLAKRYKTG